MCLTHRNIPVFFAALLATLLLPVGGRAQAPKTPPRPAPTLAAALAGALSAPGAVTAVAPPTMTVLIKDAPWDGLALDAGTASDDDPLARLIGKASGP